MGVKTVKVYSSQKEKKMVEIKGSVLNEAIKSIRAHYGEQAYETILEKLDPEARAFFKQTTILSSNWYSFDSFFKFLEADMGVTIGGEEKLIQRAEMLIERQLNGIYKPFVKPGEPRYLLSHVGVILQTYYRGITIETSFPSAGKAVFKYFGFEKRHRLIELTFIGFYRKALEVSEAKNIDVKCTTSIGEGKGYFILTVHWSE